MEPGSRNEAGQFVKGQSGNPKGKSKATTDTAAEIQALAAQHCCEAIKSLVHIMKEGTPDSARVMAADKILDRGCGRAPQTIAGDNPDGSINFILRHIVEAMSPE